MPSPHERSQGRVITGMTHAVQPASVHVCAPTPHASRHSRSTTSGTHSPQKPPSQSCVPDPHACGQLRAPASPQRSTSKPVLAPQPVSEAMNISDSGAKRSGT